MQILTHNPSYFLSRDTPLLASPHTPKLAIINLTCHVHLPQEFWRASAACSIANHPHIRYRTYLVLLFNTTSEEILVLFVQSHLTWLLGLLVTFCVEGVFLAQQTHSNAHVACFLSFVMFSKCLSRGGWGHAKLA